MRACRTVADKAPQLTAVRPISRPEQMPESLDLNDWLVVDLDLSEVKLPGWAQRLGSCSCQIVATGSDEPQVDVEMRKLGIRRFFSKDTLAARLTQLLAPAEAGNRQNERTWTSDRPTSGIDDDAIHVARQLAEFATRLMALEADRITEAVLTRLPLWFGARLVSLYALDPQRRSLVLLGKTHPHDVDERIHLDHQGRQPIVRAAKSRQLILSDTWQQTEDILGSDVLRPRGEAYETEACIVAPLTAGSKLVGVLNLADPIRSDRFDPRFMGLIEPICRLIGSALDNAGAHREVRQQAQTDSLTELANRRSFKLRLKQELMRARRYGTPLSLAMIDVDMLKDINDTYGHPAGDAVIRETAERIRATIREIDTAARYGGDEFAVILPSTSLAQAQTVADRLAVAMSERSCHWHGRDIRVTFSIGLCEYEQQTTPEELIETADRALYAAKSGGRNRVTVSAS
ncbi:MAG: diguanylate cyclase [Phycisphaerae bacterium]|nr:diguanylate cyclase [Phycisphaerae bacterium]